jgi:hypothetical protein
MLSELGAPLSSKLTEGNSEVDLCDAHRPKTWSKDEFVACELCLCAA